jgi:hypothetical protein
MRAESALDIQKQNTNLTKSNNWLLVVDVFIANPIRPNRWVGFFFLSTVPL